jgi:hypothetical protein
VSNSQANNNGGDGIIAGALPDFGATISHSETNNNVGAGIRALGANNLLTHNTAKGNASDGIVVVCPSNLYGNTATGKTGGNIVTSGSGCAFLGNTPAP